MKLKAHAVMEWSPVQVRIKVWKNTPETNGQRIMGKKSSPRQASKAAKVLNDPKASDREKKLAGSVLSQARKGAETTPELADFAGRVLDNPSASDTAHSLAGSVLSQTPKKK